jgi:hypothetical protein
MKGVAFSAQSWWTVIRPQQNRHIEVLRPVDISGGVFREVFQMSRILLSSVAVAAVLASVHGAAAQTEIQWWHAMGGNLGETVNALAD